MRQTYSWNKVTAGDIISFRYKSPDKVGLLSTILVLNPKPPHNRKDGTRTFHLVGLKLEHFGTLPTIRSKPKFLQLLEETGTVRVVDVDNEIFRVDIIGAGVRGAKKSTYRRIKKFVRNYSIYRTYDYKRAIKSAVFLEPVVLPKEIMEELLVEN